MLVKTLRKFGHAITVVPLYLPWVSDNGLVRPDTPLFFNGVSCYLQQNYGLFRHTPGWLDRMLESAVGTNLAARRAGSVDPGELGPLTVSMLQGPDGRQKKELRRFLDFLGNSRPPQVILLSNAMLAGLAKPLKDALKCKIVCSFQGEHSFVDQLPAAHREAAWSLIRSGLQSVDACIAPSHYCRDLMAQRLQLPADSIRVIHNGILLENYPYAYGKPQPPTLGYLARMTKEKGLDTLIEAYVLLRSRPGLEHLSLRVAGAATPHDRVYVEGLRERLVHEGMADDVEFHFNVSAEVKRDLLATISVLSVPATYGEAFGLYVIEAQATGVPVVQPRHGAFPEILEITKGGELVEPDDPEALASALAGLLLDPDRAEALGKTGRDNCLRHFSVEKMAGEVIALLQTLA